MPHQEQTQPSVTLTVRTSKCVLLQQRSLTQASHLGATWTSTFRTHQASPLALDITKSVIKVQTTKSMGAATVYRSTTMRLPVPPSQRLTRLDGPTSKSTYRITGATTSNFALSWSTTMLRLQAVIRFTTRPPCQDGTSTTSASEAPCHNRVGWAFVAFFRMSKAAKTIQTATEFWPLKLRQPRRLFSPLMYSIP